MSYGNDIFVSRLLIVEGSQKKLYIELDIIMKVSRYNPQFNGKSTCKKNVPKVWSTPSFKA